MHSLWATVNPACHGSSGFFCTDAEYRAPVEDSPSFQTNKQTKKNWHTELMKHNSHIAAVMLSAGEGCKKITISNSSILQMVGGAMLEKG